jgi:WD40 repeat protein
MLVVGSNDGRYGIVNGASGNNAERRFTPTFGKAAMTDQVLAIACAENCIDIHETQTGKRIGSVSVPDNRTCKVLSISPNGEFLAAGIDNGDAIFYFAGESGTFEDVPPRLIRESGIGAINSIAFSHNNMFVSTCIAANTIYTYELRGTEVVKTSRYDRDLLPKQCKNPYFGVTGIS